MLPAYFRHIEVPRQEHSMRRRVLAWLLIAIPVLAVIMPATADEPLGDLTIDTVTRSGNQVGCAINFTIVGQDVVC